MSADDPRALLSEMEYACQLWGGVGNPLLPVSGGQLPSPYIDLLRTEQVDFVGGCQSVSVELPFRVKARHPWDYPVLAVVSHEPLDRWRTVRVTELDEADPCRPIYDALLASIHRRSWGCKIVWCDSVTGGSGRG